MTELNYPFTVRPLSNDEGGGYLIEFPDLPGCMSDGETPEDALRNGADALRCWIEAMGEAGRQIPAPRAKSLLAIPDFLYDEVAREAELRGMSVETFFLAVLTAGLLSQQHREENASRKRRREPV